MVRLFDLPSDSIQSEYCIEEEESVSHDDTLADLTLRGLSPSQKEIVLTCVARCLGGPKFITREFERQASL